MRREWIPARKRALLVILLLPSMAMSCEPMDLVQMTLDRMSPDAAVDPASVDPPDPGEQATGRYRSIDGTGNHETHFELGAAHTTLRRLMSIHYGDLVASMGGSLRPSPRAISNAVCADSQRPPNALGASDFLWQWGQFVDHDIDLSGEQEPAEPMPIPVPAGDPSFDPGGSGFMTIDANRTLYHPGTGNDPAYPRQQVNEITHFIDASNVYGSDPIRAALLRTNDGTGRLLVSAGDLLPFNIVGLPNAGGTGPELFLAGDVRANEQVALTAMHALFVREHNRLASEIAANDPALTGEEIYQEARRIVGALMQVITYKEFLPALLGPDPMSPYTGYRWSTSPAILNEFSTAIYRFGHSALSPTLLRLDAAGNEITQGHLPLRQAFFRPDRLVNEGGIEPILRGLASQPCSAIDTELVDDVRNFLFGPPGAGGFDLASLNIQRGRDHGLPSYNDARRRLGLAPRTSFTEVSSDPDTQTRLASVYADVEDIDLWVGALAEDPVNGGHVGEVAYYVIVSQFRSLRDGDRYWYQAGMYSGDPDGFSMQEVADLEATTLADVIRRNTTIGAELSDDVFQAN
ncbi:MAG: peroxiredoxin [Myxococcales bacterium]|nr:peroxiredoxin [Deltaproteobacteria bacterium]NNL24347.1 peroxiredoxin [Myxococcales bacterium]